MRVLPRPSTKPSKARRAGRIPPPVASAPTLPMLGWTLAWPKLSMMLAVAVGLGAGALLLRLYRLAAQSLWLDEGSTWALIQASWATLFADLVSPAAAYPLYHLLLKAWVALAGDSEWALRLPSAVAGAVAVGILFGVARHFARMHQRDSRATFAFSLAAAVLMSTAPFAIWYAQEAKVYSMLLVASILLLWATLRVVQHPTRRAWLTLLGIALLSIFLHRLAILLVLAIAVVWLWLAPAAQTWRVRLLGGAAVLATSVGLVLLMARGLGSDIAETGAYIPATPMLALKLTLLRFSLDRGPGEFPLWWIVPFLMLGTVGLYLLLRDARQPRPQSHAARVLLCFLCVPTGLFLAQLGATRLFEARYLLLIYPAWLLLLVYPLLHPARVVRGLSGVLLAGVLLVHGLALTQAQYGIFSGDPVKEQYREAIAEVATRMHPDDLIVLHPAYIRPLYDYYMARHTSDTPPEPVTFDAFKHGQHEFTMRDWYAARREAFAGYYRSFLIIAPAHARTVDQPLLETDEYGLVGIYYQYSWEQRKWPCGIWRTHGVHVFCQDSPEAYETGALHPPGTPYAAQFGEDILLKEVLFKATLPQGAGVYQAGGNLPLTLFWDVVRQPQHEYITFLHLCQQCDLPPPAGSDGPPLEGYLPTTIWLPGKPVHDEQTIPLPADLPPGEYHLYLGMYPSGDADEAARLPIQSTHPVDRNRLWLGTVQVVAR